MSLFLLQNIKYGEGEDKMTAAAISIRYIYLLGGDKII